MRSSIFLLTISVITFLMAYLLSFSSSFNELRDATTIVDFP